MMRLDDYAHGSESRPTMMEWLRPAVTEWLGRWPLVLRRTHVAALEELKQQVAYLRLDLSKAEDKLKRAEKDHANVFALAREWRGIAEALKREREAPRVDD